MKKLLFPLLGILLFTACTKETPPVLVMDDIGSKSAKAKQGKIEVCHKEGNGKSHTITINANALKAHLSHGDALGSCVPTVTICDQVWMVKNLDVTTYRNGDPIPQVTDPSEWAGLTTGAWCYYENNTENGKIYGKLYNWYAVNDTRGLAPQGWHIPGEKEWLELISFLGGDDLAGGKLKATTLWESPNTDANNSSGFSALPGGMRSYDGRFGFIYKVAGFWSSSENIDDIAWYRALYSTGSDISRYSDYKTFGLSVRCVKD